MAFEALEHDVEDAVIDTLANADVSIDGAPAVRGIFDANPQRELGMVDTHVSTVWVACAAAEGVKRGSEVLINGARAYRVVGTEHDGALVLLRLAT